MSNGSVTNRLHMLERERKRLEQELADDPHWQAFCDAQRRNPAAGRLHVLSSDIVAGLTQSPCFAEYVKVVRAIERIKANAKPAPEAAARPASTGGEQPFRTRLHVKPAPDAERQHPGDDLTAIRGIDRPLATALRDLGFGTYQAIAELDRNTVRYVRDALQLEKRIWRENWIEQAALLQQRNLAAPTAVTLDPVPVEPSPEPPPIKLVAVTVPETPKPTAHRPADDDEPAESETAGEQPDTTARNDGPAPDLHPLVQSNDNEPALEPAQRPTETSEEPAAIAQTDATQTSPPTPRNTVKAGRRPQRLPAPAARRFGYLLGVSDQMAEALRSAGVNSLAEIASWTRSDVRWFQAILGDTARIAHDQWIEQATLLSRGIWTRHALRVVNGETRLIVGYPAPLETGTPALRVVPPAGPTDDETAATINEAPPRAAAALVSPSPTRVSPPLEPDPAPVPEPPLVEPEAASGDAEPATDEPPLTATSLEAAPTAPSIAESAPPEPDTPARATSHDETETTPRAPQKAPLPAKQSSAAPVEKPRRRSVSSALGKIKRPPPDLGLGKPRLQPVERTTPPPLPSPAPAAIRDATFSFRQPPPPIIDTARSPKPAVDETPPLPAVDDVAPIIDARDDWDDAEALVIKRPEPVATPAAEPIAPDPPPAAAPVDVAAIEEKAPDDPGDAADWSGEAEVVIVSRPRSDTPPAMPDDVSSPPLTTTPAVAAAAVPAGRPSGRRRFDDDDGGRPQLGYSESVEEASVTIIRAEASQEDAAAVVPNDIANDAEKPDQTAPKSSVRTIGSRFLKALTGD